MDLQFLEYDRLHWSGRSKSGRITDKTAKLVIGMAKRACKKSTGIDFSKSLVPYRGLIEKITADNYHIVTEVNFKAVPVNWDEILKLGAYFKSDSGSEYVTTETGVYRRADHWFQVASCYWRIDKLDDYLSIGYADFSSFKAYDGNYRRWAANPSFISTFPKYRRLLLRTLRAYSSKNETNLTEAAKRILASKIGELAGKKDPQYREYLFVKAVYEESKDLY